MTITVPVTKVSIFLRWTSWLIRHALAGKHDFVIIHCDETMLPNLQCWSHGTFITRARTPRITSTLPACTPRELRMTLLAAITNEPELQNRLPQVFLPKTKKGGLLSPDDLTIWEQFQSPLEVWHGSSGWVTQIIFKKWLTHVRRVVHCYRSTAWVVLLMDCSPVHMTRVVLRHCCRLGIMPLFVPARTTWLLQPLDVYAFGPLKRDLMRRHQRARIANPTGELLPHVRMANCGAAVMTQLVQKTWGHCFEKCGAGRTMDILSQHINTVAATVNLKARVPSPEELAELLGRESCRYIEQLGSDILELQKTMLTRAAHALPPTWYFGLRHAVPAHETVPRSPPARAPAPASTIALARPAAVRAVRLMLPSADDVATLGGQSRVGPSAGTRSQVRRGHDSLRSAFGSQ